MTFNPIGAWVDYYRQLGVNPAEVRVADALAAVKARDVGNGCPLWVADLENGSECAYCSDPWEAHSERARMFGATPPPFQGPIPPQVSE